MRSSEFKPSKVVGEKKKALAREEGTKSKVAAGQKKARTPVAVVGNLTDDKGKPIKRGQDCSNLSKERLARFVSIGGVVYEQS